MALTAPAVVGDAWALFRRDRPLLMGLAGPFWFLPVYALKLLVPPIPQPPAGADSQAQAAVLAPWLATNGGWFLLAFAIGLCGSASVYALYAGPDQPTAAQALRRGVAGWWRLLLASGWAAALLLAIAMLLSPLGTAGIAAPMLLALYGVARLLPLGPALAEEQPLSAMRGLGRAWRLTRGAGWPLALLVAALLGVGMLASGPLSLLDGWLRANDGGVNPVAVAIVDAAAALVSAGSALASALLGVASYRRLAR